MVEWGDLRQALAKDVVDATVIGGSTSFGGVAGGAGGAALGGIVGTLVVPGFGTAIGGAIGGAAGAIAGKLVGGCVTEPITSYIFDLPQTEALEEAFKYFEMNHFKQEG